MGHRDGRRDELYRAGEVRGQRPWDACLAHLRGSDAWDGVRRDATADGRRAFRQKPDAGAEKSAGRVLGGRGSGDLQSGGREQPTVKMH